MRTASIRFAALGAAALAIAACSGSGPAAPSVALPSVAIPSLEVPSVTIPPVLNPDAGLESLFPDTVGGNEINVESAQGQSVYGLFNNTDTAEFDQFLSDLGTDINQISAAISFHIWPGPTEGDFTGLTITAFRAPGISAAQSIAGFSQLVAQDVENAEIGTANVGGKAVTSIVNPDDAEQTVYLYGVNDVVFMVGGTPAHVEEALSKLP